MTLSIVEDHGSLDDYLQARAPNQPEFHQAVNEVMADLLPIIERSDVYQSANIFERIIEPERAISFQVAWQNDSGQIEVNRGYRVQFNGAIGPYKGGLRFHPSVNTSVLKFLAFEQIFKNALTGLPMGGAKGGSDFNPRGRSRSEIMRFCNAFMQEFYRHIDPDTDIPAGDINVGATEIGFLFGAYRRISNQFEGVLTGKGLSYGGSQLRAEATGFGAMYFLRAMLGASDDSIEGKTVALSGAGNVATYAAQKAIDLGATVISLSDSAGLLHVPDGLTSEQIAWVRQLKADRDATLEPFVDEFGGQWTVDATPWELQTDIAVPCATQNELDQNHAESLINNGVIAIVEGANMPCTSGAVQRFADAGIMLAPGKAANAGGVAVSGLEISQNRNRKPRSRKNIEDELQTIMTDIHDACVKEGSQDGKVNYARGANIAGFRKVADAMVAQGVG